MPRICWSANASEQYIVDVMIGGLLFEVMIDTGVVGVNVSIGFDLDQRDFELLNNAGKLSDFQRILRKDASGRQNWGYTAEATAQILDRNSRLPIGPIVRIRVSRGMPHVIGRVGVSFFHRLTNCSVLWDLDTRTWCIDCP